MSQHTQKLFVGIDAHLESLSIAVLAESADQPEPVRVVPNEPSKVRRYFRGLGKRGPIEAVYEAGCRVAQSLTLASHAHWHGSRPARALVRGTRPHGSHPA